METNEPLELTNLMSISGVVAFTMVLVEVLKRAMRGCQWFTKIPVFVYASGIAMGLAALANRVLKTEDGSPYLEGNLGTLIWAAMLGALASSGFYTWLHEPTPMRDASALGNNMHKTLPVILVSLFLFTGCVSCPEKPIIVESLDQGTRTIRKTHLQWVEMLGADPGKRAELPVLTPQQQENFRELHKDLDATFEEYKTTN